MVGYHTQKCAIGHIMPSVLFGGAFTALNAVQGAPITPQGAAMNIGFLYLYGALVCPMEELSRRQTAWHNLASGGILGYAGVAGGRVGIPFGLEYTFMMNRVPLPVGGAVVYGAMGFAMAAVMGKPL